MNTTDALLQIYKDLPAERPWTNIENPQSDYTGAGAPKPFPNYARTSSPEVLELWHTHQEERQKFCKHVISVLRIMTGNPDLKTFWGSGSYSTEYHVTGVAPSEIADSHRNWWKKPRQGITAPYKKHSLYQKFAELNYTAPKFGDAPTYLWGGNYMGRPAFFEHNGYLYFGTSITGYTARNYPWWEDASPWEPIKRWEWEKAKDEHTEDHT